MRTVHNAYAASGIAQWTSEFDGDQFVEVECPADMPLPEQQGDTFIEIYTHGHAGNAAVVAEIVYDTSATGDNEIR